MNVPLRAGIVGAGFIGGVHAHAVRASGGVIAAVADSTPESASRAKDRFGALRAVGSLADMLEMDDLDVIHVCTPNVLHASQAEAVLLSGKNVICEKPLATNVEDARRLTESAERGGVVAAVPFVYRYYGTAREARERIAADAAPPWLLHGSYLQDWLSHASDNNWRVDPAVGGASRAFGDIGVHWCDLMEFVTGQRIVRLIARTGRAYAERVSPGSRPQEIGTEDGATVMFETDRGAVGSLVVSQVSPGRKNRLWFSFDGPTASYVFDQENPDALWVGGRTSSTLVPRGPDTLSAKAGAYAVLPAGHPQGYQDSFNAFVADVYDAVRGGKPDGLPTFNDGLRAALLTDAVVASAASNSWVEVN